MGNVTLVGAGCGKDLITVKGLNAIKSADVIVYDDLIDDNLLNVVGDDTELIYVGKRLGHHSEKQENINKILIEKAKENKNVVRLKGGDSFVFGRGGEEILALQENNIPFDIVAGVTSSVAVPESLGIPVTHRGIAQSFTVVTGHTATQSDENYNALAKLKGTLVFLMGLHNIENICKRLIDNGKAKSTPASILSKGYDKEQSRIDGTLEDIASKAHLAKTPAIFVVGEVANFDFRKTKSLPLDNVSITVTGTKEFTSKISNRLTLQGAFVKSCPDLKIQPKDLGDLHNKLGDYDIIVFTSSNGVKVFFDYMKETRTDNRFLCHFKFACIGKGTAKTLEKYGFYADIVPVEYTAKQLGLELTTYIDKNSSVLILRAENGSDDLTQELTKANIHFKDVKTYDTLDTHKNIDCDTDYITFASASGVAAFFENGGRLNNSTPVCIGEITASEFQKYSNIEPLVAKNHTADGIISLILEDKNEKI
jgi:uroporphyrinogen III methyltransferase/synthase